jgi:hypothetical protein
MSQTTKVDLLVQLERARRLVRDALDKIEAARERETVLMVCASLRDKLFSSPTLKPLALVEDRSEEQLRADGDEGRPCAECGRPTSNTPDGNLWLCLCCERLGCDEQPDMNTPDGSGDFSVD